MKIETIEKLTIVGILWFMLESAVKVILCSMLFAALYKYLTS